MIENPVSVSPLDWQAVGSSGQHGSEATRLREVATQFESLLIAQMLSSMRQADGSGWLGSGEDKAGSTMTELAEQCLAQSMASSGGLGLAPIVEHGLGQARGETGTSSTPAISRRR